LVELLLRRLRMIGGRTDLPDLLLLLRPLSRLERICQLEDLGVEGEDLWTESLYSLPELLPKRRCVRENHVGLECCADF
jgi:hypothetical protein